MVKSFQMDGMSVYLQTQLQPRGFVPTNARGVLVPQRGTAETQKTNPQAEFQKRNLSIYWDVHGT